MLALLTSAQQMERSGNLSGASASLERAQRIAPREPQVLYRLAEVRLAQGDAAQAEQLARRGLSYAGGRPTLQASLWDGDRPRPRAPGRCRRRCRGAPARADQPVMDARIPALAEQLLLIERELRLLGWWSEQMPAAERLASVEPFCVDTLALEEWLQWIFLPRMKALIESGGTLPGACAIRAMAEQAWPDRRPAGDRAAGGAGRVRPPDR